VATFVAAIFLTAVAASQSLAQRTITVTTTSDGFSCPSPLCSPQCSLRDAIIAANDNRVVNGCAAGQSSGVDRIVFNVGSGTPTIMLRSALPPITEPVEIDGGTGGATRIEISGDNILRLPGNRVDGLILATGESTIRNLVINGFGGNGIVMTAITGGYLPDHEPPTIPDPSIPRGPNPGQGEDIPPVGGAGSGNKIFGCFIGTDKT